MKITGSEKTNNKNIFIIIGVVLVIVLVITISLLLNNENSKFVENDIIPTPTGTSSTADLNVSNTPIPIVTENTTLTPEITPWNQNTVVKDIVELPVSKPALSETTEWPIENIEEYIDKSKMIEANWESVFAPDGIEVGDLDSLRKSNKEKFKAISKKYGMELNGTILEEFLENKLNEIHANIKHQILNYPDSLETDILLRLIEYHKPGHDEFNNTLFGSTAPKGLNVREWFDIAAYWIFNNDFNYKEENQESYSFVYTNILNQNLFLEESKDIKFLSIWDRGSENLEIDSMKISFIVYTVMNGELNAAIFSVKDNELILIDY